MDVATALTVAQTLFATLQCAEVRKLCSICNYESELQKLLDTVNTIKNFLLDADSKCHELTNEGQYWVQNLKDAIYDADDLMDEFNTIAHQLKRMPGGKVMKKVRRFFSSNNQLIFAVNKSNEIKNLREKLGSLARNHRDFGFSELYKPMKSREKTSSYVYEQSIIGRDADKEAVVDLLLQDETEKNISFVTIVGIGGMGKTALSQLVFNDPRIKKAFHENMYWVCVYEDFSMEDILGKMISSKELELEDLQRKVRDQIGGKRYLLVLDDVWSEDGRKWDELKNFLILGGSGTRILVTSRSKEVAGAIGNYPIHELGGLSVEDSWILFRKISLGQRVDEAVTALVHIGKDIVKKCANVPLSIRVIAGLLRNQDIATWQSLKGIDLANMCDSKDGIMPTLMFSYYHLATELKSCFSFCALFPEDCVIRKKNLIRFWMAERYLVPSAKTESMEDVGEKYISILLHRCFFQDIKRDYFGEVESFKMHDLIHELARKVAAKEFPTACTNDFDGKVRHRFIVNNDGLTTWLSSSNHPSNTLRTCLIYSYYTVRDVDAMISICSRLRVLILKYSTTKVLPESLGKLLHLRYLDLSHNKQLTSLHTLTEFFVCEDDDDKKGKLTDLIALIHNLRGNFFIKHYHNSSAGLGLNLMEAQLVSSQLDCKLQSYHKQGEQETLLENLLLNHKYHEMSLRNYESTKLPIWASGLVSINLSFCKGLKHLPSLSQLLHLKFLSLVSMESIEYIESDAPSPSAIFFPSLEKLVLSDMPKLERWWGDIRQIVKVAVFIPSFPQLRELDIVMCQRLIFFPPCSLVNELDPSKPIYLNKLKIDNSCVFNALFRKFVGSTGDICIKLIGIENLGKFREGFQRCARCIQDLIFYKCMGMENLGIEHLTNLKSLTLEKNIEGMPWEYLPSISSLKIMSVEEVILPKGIQYLTSLQSFSLKDCFYLEDLGECFNFLTLLQLLHLENCFALKSLPEEMCHLTSLTTLTLHNSPHLKSLPEAMRHLTSLTTLTIIYPNPELKRRCQKPDGEDWPNTCHIPTIYIKNTNF